MVPAWLWESRELNGTLSVLSLTIPNRIVSVSRCVLAIYTINFGGNGYTTTKISLNLASEVMIYLVDRIMTLRLCLIGDIALPLGKIDLKFDLRIQILCSSHCFNPQKCPP